MQLLIPLREIRVVKELLGFEKLPARSALRRIRLDELLATLLDTHVSLVWIKGSLFILNIATVQFESIRAIEAVCL